MGSDSEQELKDRLSLIESRLSRLEQRFTPPPTPAAPGDAAAAATDFTFRREPRPRPQQLPQAANRAPVPVTQILGWGGVAALVLAAAYLIRLGIDLGWLTPGRQLLLALLAGCGLIGGGLALRHSDRHYASLLPAGGVIILFLSTYGAHLYYRLIPYALALTAVAGICLLALWLCRTFASQLYAFFAVCGSYSAPLLLPDLRSGVTELAVYYTAWGLLFCGYAVWFVERRIYLVAACLALLGFDLIWYLQWHHAAAPQWREALVFQSLQFAIFAGVTALFTLQHDDPLDRDSGLAHLPPLLLFYALEYGLLQRYLPALAPWIAFASLAVVLLLYLLVRSGRSQSLPGGEVILGAYAALVLFHAGYLELLPDPLAPWAGLAVGAALALWLVRRSELHLGHWALLCTGLLVFAINLLRAVTRFDLDRVAAGDYLALAYAAELYAGAVLLRRRSQPLVRTVLLYAGHLAAMAAPVHLFDSRLAVSLTWAVLAVAALALALHFRDRLLGQSALFIFAASGAKVFLYDLSGTAPLIRIGSLVVLGVSLYLGGWLYRRVGAIEEETAGCGQ